MTGKALLALLLMTTTVSAQTVKVSPDDIRIDPPIKLQPPGEDRIVTLQLNQPAPFAGQLYDPQTALRWGLYIQQLQARYKTDMAAQINTCTAQLEHAEKLVRIEQTRAHEIEQELEGLLVISEDELLAAQAAAREEPGFFESNGFYFAMGILVSGAAVGLGAWAASAYE